MTQFMSKVLTICMLVILVVGEVQDRLGLSAGFSSDFLNFLQTQGWEDYHFDHPEIDNSCYGGADTRPSTKPTKIPIIFIHGNSDIGFGTVGSFTGARQQFEYLTSIGGYSKKDLYTFTWGKGDPNYASYNYHSKQYVNAVRAFIEAVLAYTKADKVNIIAHSMGVTLSRKAVKGGAASDLLDDGAYNVGQPLTGRINLFVGLAGANEGLADCYLLSNFPTCGYTNGFYPGNGFGLKGQFLAELDGNPAREGTYVASIWSYGDDLIKYNCLVYGQYTPRIKNQNEEIVFQTLDHFGVRDKTNAEVLALIRKRE